jgi:hypothetical protein
MENEMPLVCHIVEQQRCDYKIKDDESLTKGSKDIQRQNPSPSLCK